jgi:hypothetical protein
MERQQIGNESRWLNHLHSVQARAVTIGVGIGVAVPSARFQSEGVVHLADARLMRINPRDALMHGGTISVWMGARERIVAFMGEIAR